MSNTKAAIAATLPLNPLWETSRSKTTAGRSDAIQNADASDAHWISETIQGNPNAFVVLVKRYESFVYRFCLSMLRNTPDAEDAAQETFIKAYDSLKKFRNESSLQTWLGSIAMNQCRDRLRKRKRQRTESLEKIVHDPKLYETLAANQQETSPETQAIYWELTELLLSTLNTKQRATLTLREVSGFSYEEIASTLGISLSATKSILRRARLKLNRTFPDLFGDS